MPFRIFGLEPRILKAVEEAGYTEPTPIQSAAIPPILAGHDLIGIAQTGTGKTAAFVLPILAKLAGMPHDGSGRGIRALVIAPTRELAAQIEENVRIYGKHLSLRAATIYGGVSEKPQIEALRRGVDLLVATPGRLLDLMGRQLCDFSRLNFLVLDEAERMLAWAFCRTSSASFRHCRPTAKRCSFPRPYPPKSRRSRTSFSGHRRLCKSAGGPTQRKR